MWRGELELSYIVKGLIEGVFKKKIFSVAVQL